jgi:hypothetical protein
MMAGLLLAAITGITLTIPQLAELKATLEASEREAQAYMAAAAKTGAAPKPPDHTLYPHHGRRIAPAAFLIGGLCPRFS